MALMVDRRGNNERVEGSKFQIGCERCAITQLDLVPALAYMRCRPFGNLPGLRSFHRQSGYSRYPSDTSAHVGCEEDPARVMEALLTAGERGVCAIFLDRQETDLTSIRFASASGALGMAR